MSFDITRYIIYLFGRILYMVLYDTALQTIGIFKHILIKIRGYFTFT